MGASGSRAADCSCGDPGVVMGTFQIVELKGLTLSALFRRCDPAPFLLPHMHMYSFTACLRPSDKFRARYFTERKELGSKLKIVFRQSVSWFVSFGHSICVFQRRK